MQYSQQQKDPTSRMIGLGIVVFLHVLLVYFLVTGLGTSVIEAIKGPMETKIIEEDKAPPPPPPPPPPNLKPPPPAFIPLPDIQVAVQSPNAIQSLQHERPVAPPAPHVEAPPAPPKVVAPTPAHIDKAACRLPVYPPAARRAEESGTVVVAFLVGPDGAVKESKVTSSSGSTRLDEAARVALSLCKFVPATIEGKPVANETWTEFKYVWKLED